VSHVTVLASALSANDSEIMNLLEKEYALKLSGRIGKMNQFQGATVSLSDPSLTVSDKDYFFIRKLYDAYRMADKNTQLAFATVCENMLKLTK
jgi:hypothetical protein